MMMMTLILFWRCRTRGGLQTRRRDVDDDEDENQVRGRRHRLQLLPVHAAGVAVLVRHLRAHRRPHPVAVRVATGRRRLDVPHRTLRRIHNHLLAGIDI